MFLNSTWLCFFSVSHFQLYSPGTNVNKSFFQELTIVFRRTKVGTGSLCAHCFCQFWGREVLQFVLVDKLMSCFKMASDRAKWSNYEQSHIRYSKCEHTTILCRYPGTGSRVPSVEMPFQHSSSLQLGERSCLKKNLKSDWWSVTSKQLFLDVFFCDQGFLLHQAVP